MSNRQIRNPWLSDVFTTTTATPTVATNASATIPSGAGGHVEITATGRNTSTGASASMKVIRAFQAPSGVLALVGTIGVIAAATGDATMVAIVIDVTLSGSTVQPRVTGIALTNIEWLVSAEYFVN
jgi:hypothetical protein